MTPLVTAGAQDRLRKSKARIAALVLGGLLGCGGAPSSPEAADSSPAPAEVEAEPSTPAVPDGDALLASARGSIRDGAIDPKTRQQILESKAPPHARAARLLRAMDAPDTEAPTEPEPDTDTPLVAPGPSDPPPVTIPPGSATPAVATTKKPAAHDPEPPPAAKSGAVRVGRLGLRSSDKGGVLTIAAPSSLVVGVANQTASGIVHLIIESARADPAVLRARPKVEGAQVTAVRQGQGTIQITLRLDPGWSLGRVVPTKKGAQVRLRPPG